MKGRIPFAAALCLGLVLAHGTVAQAQLTPSPYAAGVFGVGDLRNRIPIQTNPPTDVFVADHYTNVLAAVHLGLEIGAHVALDAGLRSTLAMGQPFRALTLGPALRLGQRVQVRVRGGFGRVQGFQAIICVAIATPCPPYIGAWLNGFDLEASVDHPGGAHWSIGPAVWWAQSVSGTTQYRSVGAGVRVRYR